MPTSVRTRNAPFPDRRFACQTPGRGTERDSSAMGQQTLPHRPHRRDRASPCRAVPRARPRPPARPPARSPCWILMRRGPPGRPPARGLPTGHQITYRSTGRPRRDWLSACLPGRHPATTTTPPCASYDPAGQRVLSIILVHDALMRAVQVHWCISLSPASLPIGREASSS
jgi:hypothetical protein